MPFDDLPAGKLRDAVRAAVARGEARPAPSSPGARPVGHNPRARARNTYRCACCGHEETAYKAAERHADEARHARIDLVLSGVT